MPTALDMIKRSLRLVRAIGKGEIPDADESVDALAALNAMMDSWAAQRMFVYSVTESTKVLTAGTASYTMGASGSINATRPDRLTNGCYIESGSTDYPLEPISEVDYSRITDKDTRGIPSQIYLRQAVPLATLYLYPAPDSAYTLHVMAWARVQSFATLPTAMTLPSGYEEAIVYSLAERIAPEYGLPADPSVAALASRARNALVANNAQRMRLSPSADMANAGLYSGHYDVRTGL